MRCCVFSASTLLCCALALIVSAQDAAPALDEAAIQQLIQQLDADKFADRQSATQKLADAGPAAIAALAQAAAGPNRESSSRSVDILKKHFQSKDEALQKSAREALEKLAKSEQPRVASAAKEAIKPQAKPSDDPFGVPRPGIQIIGGQVQMQMRAIAGGVGNKRVGIQNVNGVKTTTVEENGRKVVIVDDPQNGIKLEVTEKVDGKEQTKKYEAKDADELKKKHPDAHKLYDEYSKQQGIQIQFGGAAPPLPLPPGGIGQLPGLAPFRVPVQTRQLQGQLEKIQKDLHEVEDRVKKAAENSPQADQLGKAVQQLESVRKQLEEAIEKLKSP